MSEVIERLVPAMNAHDLDAAAGFFHEDYRGEQPAHPGRAFVGRALPSDVVTEILKQAAGTRLLLAELASFCDPDARPGQLPPVSDIVKATVDEHKDHSILTVRELEVAGLIARGLTNPVIAGIVHQPGFSSRSQIAA